MKQLTKFAAVLLTICLFTAYSLSASAKGGDDVSLFPAAPEGMVRHVIELSKKSDESAFKVEIVPGKVMSVDCNVHRLMGTLTEKNLEGWGYTYYEFSSDGKTTSTLMACNKPNVDKFVSGQTLIVRYNSKLPIVVYAPKGFEVKYKIWKAGKEQVSKVK